MKKSVFHALQYSGETLFSAKFRNIVGSSLILSFIFTLFISVSIILWGFLTYTLIGGTSSVTLVGISGLLGFPFFVIFLVTLSIFLRGWYAIIIPIRSIDTTKHMDMQSDWTLYREHIGKYISYITWYSLIFGGIVIVGLFFFLLASAIDSRFGWIYAGVFGIGLLYLMTRLFLTWYHMLSEGSPKYKTFKEGIKITKGKVWKICLRICGFALVVVGAACVVESLMIFLLSIVGFGSLLDATALVIQNTQHDIIMMLGALGTLLGENIFTSFFIMLIFGAFYSVSSVLTRAMFHIFYVRYYLDMREEHEMEHSFIMPILRKSGQHHD